MSSTSSTSSRQQSDADDSLRAKLASLPTTTESERAYAALAQQLLDSAHFWRNKAESERRKHEQTTQAAQQAVTKLTQMVAAEGESLLSSLRSGSLLASPAAGSASPLSTMLLGHASGHATHPSHLSRRVSFNNDVLMVVSPDIGKASADSNESRGAGSAHTDGSAGGVSRIDEEGAAGGAPPSERDGRHKERRLSRAELEFNEGAILKKHLSVEALEKPDLKENVKV